jgi:hypothetical protein
LAAITAKVKLRALNGASSDAIFDAKESGMRTTVTLDDKLLQDARDLTGVKEVPTLIRMGLEALVSREAGRRLARLGGTQPGLQYIPRRRPPNFLNDEASHPEAPDAKSMARKRKRAAE